MTAQLSETTVYPICYADYIIGNIQGFNVKFLSTLFFLITKHKNTVIIVHHNFQFNKIKTATKL